MEAHWPGWLRTVTRINYDVITSLAITIGGQNGRQIGSPRSSRVGGKDRGKCELSVRAKEKEREKESSGKDEGQENNESRNTVHTKDLEDAENSGGRKQTEGEKKREK